MNVSSILRGLGLRGSGPRKCVRTVRLEIVAEQLRAPDSVRRGLNERVTSVESRAEELDRTVAETLQLTKENQGRLLNIEENLSRVIRMSESLLRGRAPVGGGCDGDSPGGAAQQREKKPDNI